MIEFMAGVAVGIMLMCVAIVSFFSKPKNARRMVERLAAKGYRA